MNIHDARMYAEHELGEMVTINDIRRVRETQRQGQILC